MKTKLFPILIFCTSLLTACVASQQEVTEANERMAITVERECADVRIGAGEGYRVPARGYQNVSYRVQCIGYDGVPRVIWFTSRGTVDMRIIGR